ncbi:hypothetical protein [Streptosporangium nondiastaticum]|uniref:hypothetical protein n=1 Tax=Streptosporangium nondiastaticum TaxID=35764 RepID=UPI0011B215D0|nr:hypothetical protein [Streptosporangium nondiastaticum]
MGQALVTNRHGHTLMVTRPSGSLELPGGESKLEEPAVRPAAYSLRRLGLHNTPGPLLTVDHMEAIPLGATGDRFTFIFYCGQLTDSEAAALLASPLPDDVTELTFLNPIYLHPSLSPYDRRCLDAALAALRDKTGTPYLRNGIRSTRPLHLPT